MEKVLNLACKALAALLSISFVLATSCGQADYVPKPKGYPKVYLPKPGYAQLSLPLPYSFLLSKYAKAEPDSDRYAEPNWIDIYYPAYDATIEVTYKAMSGRKGELNEYIELARKLTNKHQVKASGILEKNIITRSGHIAHVFRLTGQVPTQYQFFVTDSSHNFLRGALYFKTATANDSLKPMIDYISRDLDTLLSSLTWQSSPSPKGKR